MSPPDHASAGATATDATFRAALLHLMEDACATLDADARIDAVNAGMEELFETHQSNLLGRRLPDIFETAGDRIEHALADGCAWEAELDAAEGRTVRLQLSPTYGDDGEIAGWVAMARVIDLIRKASNELAASYYDPLTNLPGRTLVLRRLAPDMQQARKGELQVTVLCLDLDGFDAVNREHGRAVGDQVLIQTARRIGRSMRASNIVGRLQEDMFVVAISDMRSHEQINAVAQRLIAAVAVPFQVKGVREPVLLTASVGIAIAPENATDGDVLLGDAQAAVDLAKQTGTGTYQFYSNATGGEARERRSRVNRLRRAIDDGQMQLRYQPKVSLASGEIVAAEALVRWQDPDSGLIMPADFIPLAEDAGLIDPLGRKVLIEACTTLARWKKNGMPFLRVAVNVSAREIARTSFYDDLVTILRNTGIEPDSLELEITESAVMEGAEEVIRSLREIRELGVHLTADDFGTGYASLSYLRNFPLDGIKIDTTFVSDIVPGGGGLASAVIAVGHCLDMNVVAEGVETEDQLAFLRWRDCDEVQGYLIAEALTAEDFVAMVEKGPVL
ncbi:MAG: EAL domain-containing protein [Rhodospirillales bacterium]|nr:EAL domain-containing protein [Rhodospirillales bacterium]MBO6786920.1 EAL domain-containing protein [Rhodospirillales bacterium]